jgi:hypothetical protein
MPETDPAPSGKLSIEINENLHSPLKRKFNDLANRPLESLLNDVLAAFAAHAAQIQIKQRKAEEERRQQVEREARLKCEAAFEEREKRRMQFIDAIHAALEETVKLTGILSHLDGSEGERPPSIDQLMNWIRLRLRRTEALLNPTFLDLSIRCAEVEFAEKPDIEYASSIGHYSYCSKPIHLHLWAIDYENELARSISALQWGVENGWREPTPPSGGES